MNANPYEQHERDAQRMEANREEIRERIARTIHADGVIEPLPGLHVARITNPLGQVHGVLEPSFCVVAQGAKEMLQGSNRYVYDPFHYLLATIDLPTVSRVIEASPERPYMSLRLELSPAIVGSVMVEAGHAVPPRSADVRAIDVSPLDANLLDAVLRLVRLIETPAEAPVLMPLISREIVYRLLVGAQGGRLRHLAVLGGYTPHIARAIQRLRTNYDQTIRVEDLASDLGMSVSGFHHHFKAVTAMSPLQFQKQLRLQEARRLMLSDDMDATSAAYRVGYNDPSHFNREYKSVFGVPPMRDVNRLREKGGVITN